MKSFGCFFMDENPSYESATADSIHKDKSIVYAGETIDIKRCQSVSKRESSNHIVDKQPPVKESSEL